MSVVKSKRKESQFEVFHHLTDMRNEVTDLLLRDFGYDYDKVINKIKKKFGNREYDSLSPDEKARFDKLLQKNDSFVRWFIDDERKTIID